MSTPLPTPPDEATVAAYLNNQLPESQAEAFEVYCLDHPEFARKVELDLCMKRGLRQIGTPRRRVFQAPRLWTLAAAFAGLVVCGLLFLAWSHRSASLIAYRNLADVPLPLRDGVHFDVTLLRLRGPDATHRVVAPRGNGLLDLKIFPDNAAGKDGYTASILLDSRLSSRRAFVEHIRTDSDGFLEVFLPLSEVVGHTLKIALSSQTDSSASATPAFQLQIVAPAD